MTRQYSYCAKCGAQFYRAPSTIKPTSCCSRKCSNDLAKELGTFKGSNNSNYGNKWNDKQKEHASAISKKYREDPEFRHKCGDANRNKKFTKERIERMHGHRTPESYSKPTSDETKLKIGIKSKLKWTDEYRIKNRETREAAGQWVPLDEIPDYKIYYKLCEWDDISEYQTSVGYNIFESKGFYSGKTGNLSGVVRDHIFSRRDGFESGVFPEILRHPANLQFISNTENIKKGKESWLTFDELCSIIVNYKGTYSNHTTVINLIEQYNAGQRYDKENYR